MLVFAQTLLGRNESLGERSPPLNRGKLRSVFIRMSGTSKFSVDMIQARHPINQIAMARTSIGLTKSYIQTSRAPACKAPKALSNKRSLRLRHKTKKNPKKKQSPSKSLKRKSEPKREGMQKRLPTKCWI